MGRRMYRWRWCDERRMYRWRCDGEEDVQVEV